MAPVRTIRSVTTMPQGPSVAEVERAIALAIRAPSIHNSQPWRWRLTERALDLHAEPRRRLPAIDPDGRGLLVSCGAALYLACLGLQAQGWEVAVQRLPDPADPDLLARIGWVEQRPADERTRVLALAAGRRHTERRPFRPDPVPATLLEELRRLVEGDGVYAYLVERADQRLDLAVVVSWADRLEAEDDAYREELARWVRPDASGARQGVPVTAVPHLAPGEQRHTDVPLRDFELGEPGDQQVPAGLDEKPAWMVLFTTADNPTARLRAGEAFARLTAEAERMGLASSAATQAVDLPGVRERLRTLMEWSDHPQMILRIGWPPPGEPPPPTPRLPVEAVLTTADARATPPDRRPGWGTP
jgi:nitroreductase